ncbi:unnamed protein product [Paramecium sonneborni]|uniref:Uncharacterized protein n=1 Tax=Paramecium sonneborni TaxID=65129 RepID=A0A8S1RH84_9CILI|nr:unnamed protein product [Paramecium sonneborni]
MNFDNEIRQFIGFQWLISCLIWINRRWKKRNKKNVNEISPLEMGQYLLQIQLSNLCFILRDIFKYHKNEFSQLRLPSNAQSKASNVSSITADSIDINDLPKSLIYPYMNYVPQYYMMQQLQQMQQMQQIPSMAGLGPLRMPLPQPQQQMQPPPQMVTPLPIQPTTPPQPKTDQNLPVQVKGTKVKLNLKIIKDIPQEEDSVLDYDEIKKQSGDRQFINLKRKRRLLDQQDAPLMQTRRRSEQSQYLEIREMLNVDDKDMTLIMEAYPDTKALLQELKNGNLKQEIDDLLLKGI